MKKLVKRGRGKEGIRIKGKTLLADEDSGDEGKVGAGRGGAQRGISVHLVTE